MRRDLISVALDDAGGDADELGIRAVVEQQIFAEIHFAAMAVEALQAGSGIGRHNTLARPKARDRIANRNHVAGEFVTEDRGRNDHAGVIAAAKDLDVGAAGERGAHADEDVAGPDGGNGNPFQLHVLFAVEYGREHRVIFRHSLGNPRLLADAR